MKSLAFFLSALLFVIGSLRATDAPGMLRVLTHDRTIPREVCQEFTQKTGIPVDITTAISSMEAAEFIYTKKQPFDLLLLANDIVVTLRDEGRLLSLDPQKIPTLPRIKKKWRQALSDPQGKFRLPLDVTSMGILVDRRISQPAITGYMDALRKPRPGGVAVMVYQRDFLAAALLSLGASVNDLSPDNLNAARVILKDWLRNTSPASKEIWTKGHSDTFNALRAALIEGRHGAALLYSGDAISLMTEFPDRYDWINPTEGSLKYITVFAIPQDSARPEAAQKLIEFLLDLKIAGQLAVEPGFGLHLLAPWSKFPLAFDGHPGELQASQLMDHFSVQANITREPLQELEALFKSLPVPTAPPAP